MIDHVLGRPSIKFRKTQVFAVVTFWSFYLWKGDRHGPPGLKRLSKRLSSSSTTWQTLVLTMLYLYVTRNFGKVIGLECPEPLANLYTRSYFRATWVTTALDAGFWTAMHIQPRPLRDLCSVIFTVYYLICAEQADEKVRKIRGGLTLQHLRISWNKPTTPYIKFFTSLLRPRVTKHRPYPKELRIPRPKQSAYSEPIRAWLYFDGPLSALSNHDKIILDIPGGGFVAMNPKCHEDKLIGWSGRTGLPILALDYRKAPEHPYPYALNECYDAYVTLIQSRGRCIGLSGEYMPKIVVSGDSAGGNLAVGLTLMILQSGTSDTRRWQGEPVLPLPSGVVLIYPSLDMNIGNWMTDEQMALIKDRKSRAVNRGVIRRKSDDYRNLAPDTPIGSDDEDGEENGGSSSTAAMKGSGTINRSRKEVATSAAHTIDEAALQAKETKPNVLKTRLAMSSMISYFNDRILTPEMMRSMIILYIGPHSRPDFGSDFLLSPLLAPEALLAEFPKTYFLTGERDPLVDDTVIFAGRIRQAKLAKFEGRKELGLIRQKEEFRERDWVEVALIPGISHGFLQFVSVFPEGWKHIYRCARWMVEAFQEEDMRVHREEWGKANRLRVNSHAGRGLAGGDGDLSTPPTATVADEVESSPERERHHRRTRTGSSGDDDRPLEMSAIRSSPGAKPVAYQRVSPTKRGANGDVNGSAGKALDGKNRHDGVQGLSTPARNRRDKGRSITSLTSSDDLLGRRMHGLTGNIMGRLTEGGDHTP